MVFKTDNRHYNNRRQNLDLNKQLNLWIAYIDNDKKPIFIGKAISAKSKGQVEDDIFELYYSPSDLNKNSPFLLKGINNDWNCRYDSIRQAKYFLKKQYSNIKWEK